MSKLQIEEIKLLDNFYCTISVAENEDERDIGEATVLSESCASSKETALRQATLAALETLNAWASEIAAYYGDSVQ